MFNVYCFTELIHACRRRHLPFLNVRLETEANTFVDMRKYTSIYLNAVIKSLTGVNSSINLSPLDPYFSLQIVAVGQHHQLSCVFAHYIM